MEYIIVQAGGKGTRLRHLTRNKPKALVPVDNLPIIFHLFKKYPNSRFVIIVDYKSDVISKYLEIFADVKYLIAEAKENGTCAGLNEALGHIPDNKPFMYIWSDLILSKTINIPGDCGKSNELTNNYVGLSKDFECRWKYENSQFCEEKSTEFGVAGLFLFKDKNQVKDVPSSGEFVRWLSESGISFDTFDLYGTREFGLLEEYERYEYYEKKKCRPFNKLSFESNIVIKEYLDDQGKQLAQKEVEWYRNAMKYSVSSIPKIYTFNPIKMERIQGENVYEKEYTFEEKRKILEQIVASLNDLHSKANVDVDDYSIKEAYYNKTFSRIDRIINLVPYATEKEIVVNGKRCRNIFFYRRELENKVAEIIKSCELFAFIHGDCTFSNIILNNGGKPIFIDPRGYFGFVDLYGDIRYDWAKLYYSIVGNYDQFNQKKFELIIGENANIQLNIESNHWEDMEDTFFELIEADRDEIKLLHSIIWLSLTTYAWEDYDSICGAFYNGLWYLEELL